MLNLIGIAGESNREKLAKLFKRPTNWKDYCAIVSDSNCTVADSVAERPPVDDTEGSRYHVSGAYTGHFRATEQNDCEKNPTTCTGHVADYVRNYVAISFSPVFSEVAHLFINSSSSIGSLVVGVPIFRLKSTITTFLWKAMGRTRVQMDTPMDSLWICLWLQMQQNQT